MSGSGELVGLIQTLPPNRRRIIYKDTQKEKVKFPVLDPRLHRTTGNMYVEKGETLEEMLDDQALEKTRQIRYGGSRIIRESRSKLTDEDISGAASADIQKKLLLERQAHEAHQLELILKNNIAKTTQQKAVKQEMKFTQDLDNVEKAMKLLDNVDKTLDLIEETKRNKTRRQFEDWNTQVHGKIIANITKQVSRMDSKQLNRSKNKDYGKFLDITNRKPCIFRDIIIESEYDPLEPNRRAVKAKVKRLVDPTHIDAQKAEDEGSMLRTGPGDLISKPRLGKDTLPVELWASGQIEATPYGSFAKMMEGAGGNTGSSAVKSATMRSHITFDDFDFPVGSDGKVALDKEMPRGKRTEPHSERANTAARVFNA